MKFLKTFLAALLAVIVGSAINGLFWFGTLMGIAGALGSSDTATVMPNSIMRIDLTDNIVDSPAINPFSGLSLTSLETTRTLPLLKVLRAIETAATDDRIQGIYIN